MNDYMPTDINRQMETFRAEFVATLVAGDDGKLHCCNCGTVPGDTEIYCRPCEEERQKDQRREHERKDAHRYLDKWLEAANLPDWPWARFDNETWCELSNKRIRDAVAAWDFRSNLAICADTGDSKSSGLVARVHAFAGKCRERIDAYQPVKRPTLRFISGPELATARRCHRLGQDEPEAWTRARSVQVLLLDEIGFEGLPADAMLDLVDTRYRHQLVTAVTMGINPAGFVERYGSAIWRRLTEGGTVVDLLSKGAK